MKNPNNKINEAVSKIQIQLDNIVKPYKGKIEYLTCGYSTHPDDDVEGYYFFCTNEEDIVVADITSIKDSNDFLSLVKEKLENTFQQ